MSHTSGHFDGPLAMQQIGEQGGRAVYTLLRPLTFTFRPAGRSKDWNVIAPAGFVTDLASVPRIPLVYWLVGGRANHAAVTHDYLYRTRPFRFLFTDLEREREWYDDVFNWAMCVSQPEHGVTAVPQPWRSVMYAGVRFGGHLVERNTRGRELAANFSGRAMAALVSAPPSEAP